VASEAGKTNSLSDARASLAGFDELVSRELKEWNVPGLAIVVVRDEQVIYAQGFGSCNLEKQLPVTTNTLFAIGSTTKAFTTIVMGAHR
jgi:CubicO group peptidase (beta-lactamase class C family)